MGKGGIRRGLGLRLAKPTGEAPLVGTIAHLAHLHKDKPGPGAYDINKHYKVGGGRFGSGNPKTGFPGLFLGLVHACARTLTRSRQNAALDMLVHLKKDIPAPGAYGNPDAALAVPSGESLRQPQVLRVQALSWSHALGLGRLALLRLMHASDSRIVHFDLMSTDITLMSTYINLISTYINLCHPHINLCQLISTPHQPISTPYQPISTSYQPHINLISTSYQPHINLYQPHINLFPSMPGGRFRGGRGIDYIDEQRMRAKKIPGRWSARGQRGARNPTPPNDLHAGPGQYDVSFKHPPGQSWGKSSAPSAMDLIVSRCKSNLGLCIGI